jgi:predicted Zn-dependent peptidase
MLKRSCLMLAAILALTTLSAAQDFSGIQNRVSEFTLENGLKFILIEDHAMPIASFFTYVNAGGSDERIGIWGISHILEHMAFKGTSEIGAMDIKAERKLFAQMDSLFDQIRAEKGLPAPDEAKIKKLHEELIALEDQAVKLVKTNEFDTILKRQGGVGLNAFTSADQTMYFFSLPSSRTELWAYLESARFSDPVFREFYKEREVIREERRVRTDNSPIGRLIEEISALAFKDHPYRTGVIGPMSNIEAVSRRDVESYFRQNYNAGNMVIGVAGDVTPDQLKSLAKKYFAKIPGGKRNPRVTTVEPKQLGEKTITIYEESQPWLVLGYRCPDSRHPDFLKFSILDQLFTAGRTSRLQKKLVVDEKKALALGSFAGYPGNKYPGLYLIFALPNADVGTDYLLKVTGEEIARLREELVSPEELESAKKRLKVQIMESMGDDKGLLMAMLNAEVVKGSWKKAFEDYGRVDAITAEEIRELVKTYLVDDQRVVTRIEKKGEKK